MVANGITDGRGVRDMWTFDVARGTLTRVSFGAAGDTADNPAWSPNSALVYYGGSVGGKNGLYVVPADARSKPTLVLATDSPAVPTSTTPDGKTLLFAQVSADKRRQIFKVAIGAGASVAKPEPLHEPAGGEYDGQISPDGRWIAYVSNESGADDVYVLPFPGPGPKARISLDGGTQPRWSRDGKELFYWAKVPTSKLMAVDVTSGATFNAGQPHQLFQQLATTTWDTTPDKNRFLVELSSRQLGATLNLVTNWFEELRKKAPAKK